MEIINLTVVKTTEYREPVVYKTEDWELLKDLAINIEIEKEYIIDLSDVEDFTTVICKLFNMVNEGRYYSTASWLTKFKKIISKVNQEDKPEEKLKEYE